MNYIEFIQSPQVYPLYFMIGLGFLLIIIIYATLTIIRERINNFLVISKLDFYNCKSAEFERVTRLGYLTELIQKMLKQYKKLSCEQKINSDNLLQYKENINNLYNVNAINISEHVCLEDVRTEFEIEYLKNLLRYIAINDEQIVSIEIIGEAPKLVMEDKKFTNELIKLMNKPDNILDCYPNILSSSRLYENIIDKYTNGIINPNYLKTLMDYEIAHCNCEFHLIQLFDAYVNYAINCYEQKIKNNVLVSGIDLVSNDSVNFNINSIFKTKYNQLLMSFKNSKLVYDFIEKCHLSPESLYEREAVFLGLESVSEFVSGDSLFFEQHKNTSLYVKNGHCNEVYFSRLMNNVLEILEQIPNLSDYKNLCIFVTKRMVTDDIMKLNDLLNKIILYYQNRLLFGNNKQIEQNIKIIIDGVNEDKFENLDGLGNLTLKLSGCFNNVSCENFKKFISLYSNK